MNDAHGAEMEFDRTLRYFMMDYVALLKKDALEAKRRAVQHRSDKEAEFTAGWLMGYYRVMSTLIGQLQGFDLPLEEFDLDQFDPDKELLSAM